MSGGDDQPLLAAYGSVVAEKRPYPKLPGPFF
jgi:hypothetical protein